MSYLRSIILPFWFILFTGLCCVTAIFFNLLLNNRKVDTWMIRFWAKSMVYMSGIKLVVSGLEKLQSGSTMYIFNHQSLMDIPIVHAAVPRDFRFGAKLELFKIPIFGFTMKRLGALKIARFQRTDAIQVLNEAKLRMEKGESFILAPEGTRQRVPQLGEFKTGPFVLAINAQVPLQPIVIRGAHHILPKKAILINPKSWWTTVYVDLLEPVSTKGLHYDQRNELKERVREKMLSAYRAQG